MPAAVIDTCFLINWSRFSECGKLTLIFNRLFMPEITFNEIKSDTAISLASNWLSKRYLVLTPILPQNEGNITEILRIVADYPQIPSVDPPELYAFSLAIRLKIPMLTDNKAPKRITQLIPKFSTVRVLDSLDILKLIADKGFDLKELVLKFMNETKFKFSKRRLKELGIHV